MKKHLITLIALLALTSHAHADPLLFWSSRVGGGNDVIYQVLQWLGWGGDARRSPPTGDGSGGSPSDPSPTPRK